ncbi:cell division protein FtsH [Candidatus Berkelbacteria bacterium CG10_big_fil_rev_8_21_14_0_10_41_12]|uniref:ATP-dependent zinc metalloprotease FtsH n=1 Tax=Candidatus Berkelbacteria bacterium CG10_big_fil_rev_8_21_14_0_10_41_12 TaxID=1974513 RepID=A0A2M6WX81_9BACT|nr:MAG: cell division protein FtsH [Candidatus Berkelbacteria bacterium CG10_big_fil_rev_8_21_14_0_10_41_12]
MKTNPNQIRYIIGAIIIFLLVSAIFNVSNPLFSKPPKEVTLSEFVAEVNKDNIKEIKLDNNQVIAELKDASKIKTYKEATATLSDYGIKPENVPINVKNPDAGTFWPTFFSVILPFLLLGAFVFFIFRQAQGANTKALSFGKSAAKLANLKNKIMFKDVAGLDEAKQELFEVVEFLRHPEKFKSLGAEIPKGVLLVGPPGVGKTLLAKAVAGEAGVPFFSISASEFVEMFVGVGASRVRDLFQKAKRNAPTVIFIDEMDAIGRMRGSGLGGSHDEREQTLNQILVEMDGFDTDTRVIVLAATNRPDVLDPALLRPGRFDRRVVLSLPDKREREEILNVHAKNKPIEKSVNLGTIASGTPGLSGADLRNIVNEAAILAARKNQKTITQSDLQESIEKVLLGPERKSRLLSKKEKEITAYHEAGHAIVGRLLKPNEPIHKISIISRGMALGYTWSMPDEDKYLRSKGDFEADIAMLLAGRVAEKMEFGQLTTGASNDLDKASKIARDMVQIYGMSDKIGPVTLGQREELVFLGKELAQHKNYSEKIASIIDDEVERIIAQAEKRTTELLKKNKSKLEKLAQLLLKKETVSKEALEEII